MSVKNEGFLHLEFSMISSLNNSYCTIISVYGCDPYYCNGLMIELGNIPDFIPKNPKQVYKNKGWWGLYDWLGLSKHNNH